MPRIMTQRGLLFILGLALAINLTVGWRVYSTEARDTGEKEAFEKVQVMMQVLHLIRQDYVEADKTGYTELLYNATRGMVGTLDPFSDFLDPAEYKAMLQVTEGKFGGLGITIAVRNGELVIIAPIEGSPAAKAGVQPGDIVRKIGDFVTEGMNMQQTVAKLKGEPGTKITLSLYRPATKEALDVTIERAIIEIPPVADAQVLPDGIGYVRIIEFSEPTAARLRESLDKLTKDTSLKGLVIDLRNNPGGLLDQAVDVCSFFLPAKQLVVSTEGRRPSQKQEHFTDSRPKFPAAVPIAILVNEGSASAAEIVSGCLQDYKRAVLIGEKTFGKGSVQNLIELADGSALRLTTAHYYTPSRRIIHEHGIEPNITVRLTVDDRKRLMEADPAHPGSGKLRPDLDPQFQRAREILTSFNTYQTALAAKFQAAKTPAEPAAEKK